MVARNPNRTSTVYQGKDGYWHGRVTIGVNDDGSPDRRHVMSLKKSDVVTKVRALEKKRDNAQIQRVGLKWTVEGWLEHWIEHIAAPDLRLTSLAAYRTAVRKHLIPAVGGQRLDRLEPEHLERLYRRMIDNGAKPATAHQVHRTIRTALAEAQRRGHIGRNVATLARPPRVEVEEIEPYSVEEVRAILLTAASRPNHARWAIALALGLRQGEVLGLRWSDVDLDRGLLTVRKSRRRPIYRHGCGGTCGKHPGWCPERVVTNGEIGDTKSRAGRRVIGLPAPLVDLLREHLAEQAGHRDQAGSLWRDTGYVFASATGEPLLPNSDYHRWKALVKAAGVREARLHDARHTAATVLLVLDVPERTVMGIMGWSSTAMAARYQHVTDPIRLTVAKQVGGLLWTDPNDPREDN